MPERDQAGNGFISVIGYQAQGYFGSAYSLRSLVLV